MEESLRLAYLAAMDIPVWLLRGADEALQEARPEQLQAPPASAESPPARARRARELLGDEVRAEPPRVPVRAPRPVAVTRAEGNIDLLMALAGKTLFIDQAPPRRAMPRVLDLLAAIAVAIDGERVPVEPHPFAWPPRDVAFDAQQARDAVLGLMSKLRQTGGVVRVVLMGERAATLLLGWSAAQYAARPPTWQQATGFATPMLVTHSATQLLETPLLKAETWRELRAARDA